MQLIDNELPEDLYSELRNTKFITIKAFSLYLEVISQQSLALDPKVEHLWDKLLKWVPSGMINTKVQSVSLTQKHLLPQWLEELKLLFSDGLLGQPDDKFILPSHFHQVEIWSEKKEALYQAVIWDEKMKTFHGDHKTKIEFDPYWGRLFWCLDKWRKIIQTKFQGVHWELNPTTVDFVTKWQGGFEAIEWSEVPGFQEEMWKIKFSEASPLPSSVTSNLFILQTQLLALRGGNTLVPIEIEDGVLTISLQVVRADTKGSTVPAGLVSEETVGLINRYINAQIIPHYLDTSEQLEAALSREMVRLQPYAISEQIDSGWVVKLQEAVNQLSSIRRNLEQLGQSD